jgi:phosphotransferase system enzyme I (PtsP)
MWDVGRGTTKQFSCRKSAGNRGRRTLVGMTSAPSAPFSFQIHGAGDRALDGLFRLIALGDEDRPLEAVLTSMCADVADIARANVASIYVREEDEEGLRFTMRGNVGFPAEAIGRVHLRPGEGITGFAAERMRPVSVAVGKHDRHFKYISGLGEEKYPALLAVPILRGGTTAGVLVLQRSVQRAFSSGEVVLATALAAVINHAIERGAERERRQARSADRRAVRLAGRSIVGGAAMGRAELLPTLSALTGHEAAEQAAPGMVEATVERLQRELRKAAANAGDAAASELRGLSLILEDWRFRAGLAEGCGAPAPLKALSALARSYARVSFTVPPADRDGAEMIRDRAAEIEDLCVFVYAASLRGRPLVRSGTIVVAERLRPFAAIHAIISGACGFVVEGDLRDDSAAAALARSADLPMLAAVDGVFSWLQPEDLLVIESGGLRINPPATAIAHFRNARR